MFHTLFTIIPILLENYYIIFDFQISQIDVENWNDILNHN